ncbi:MAG: zinc-ribbon domain-containing protein [Deltaproteobacteria bacterium]|nr:zinc-ribbon domain-containing protein [Deltaproteobacteria bacterium]
MKFSCDQCNAQYMIADEKVGARGVKVKCKKCGHVIVVKPAAAAAAPEPTERRDTAGSGGNPFDQSTFNEPTQAISTAQLASLKAQSMGGDQTVVSPPPPEATVSPSPFGNPFAVHTTQPDTVRATLPPVSTPEPQMPAPSESPAAGAAGFSLPQGERRNTGEFNLDSAFGSAPAAAPAPSGRPAGEKEWYVAIDDAQIGPVDVREIEERWDAHELSEDSLAWRAGMADWQPLAEIAELAYLVTERPQKKPQAAASYAAPASGSAPASSPLPQSVGPMAFAGGGDEISGVSWKPSAASALSSLVQEELVASTKPAEEPAKAPTPHDMGMPSFGASDLFGKGGNGGTGAPAVPAPATPFAGPGGDPFGGGQSWSVPKPKTSSGNKSLTVVLALMGVIVIGLVGVVVVILLRQPVVVAPAAPVVADAGGARRPVEAAAAPAEPAATEKASAAETAAKPKAAKAKDHEGSGRPKPRADAEDKTPAKGKGKAGAGLDDLFDTPSPKAAAAAPDVKPNLTKDDVMGGVKKNAASLGPCLSAAKAKSELAPGQHTLVLDFMIQPNGSVKDGALKGPAYVMGTSLPGCFAQKMRGWQFAASKAGAPVKNFPLPFSMK